MRKMILLAAMVAIAALMLAAAPALADDNRHDDNDRNHVNRVFCDFHDCNGNDFCDFHHCNDNNNNNDNNRFFDHFNRNDFCDFFDCNRNNFRFDHNNRNFFVPEISQENEQEAESGDVNQSFNVTGGGDNSNQCVGLQGTANTGNAQNQISVLDVGGFGNFDGNNNNRFFDHRRFDNRFFDNGFNGGDVEFDDTGASIDVSPTNTTSCDQQVNQAASATG